MKILITNDDGIRAAGLLALAGTLASIGDVTVCAPLHEKSGSGHSLTIHGVIRPPEEFNIGSFPAWALDGTPADCVKFALDVLMESRPDFVVSGINRGPNNAANIFYSGTVGGATEGAVNGVPSIAVSLADYHYRDYGPAADFTAELVRRLSEGGEPEAAVYNVNVPPLSKGMIKGVKFTGVSKWQYLPSYEKRKDTFGKDYYWIAGFSKPEQAEEGSDDEALLGGYISVSPLKIDRMDRELLSRLKHMEEKPWF